MSQTVPFCLGRHSCPEQSVDVQQAVAALLSLDCETHTPRRAGVLRGTNEGTAVSTQDWPLGQSEGLPHGVAHLLVSKHQPDLHAVGSNGVHRSPPEPRPIVVPQVQYRREPAAESEVVDSTQASVPQSVPALHNSLQVPDTQAPDTHSEELEQRELFLVVPRPITF